MTSCVLNALKMSAKKWGAAVAVGLLGSVMFCFTAPAATSSQSEFAAVKGIDAQTLSVEEMHAISGELNAYDIAAALTAEAAKLANHPKLHDGLVKLANWYTTNAGQINAAFQKLGILTPCKSCK
jgi:hypothetical protein